MQEDIDMQIGSKFSNTDPGHIVITRHEAQLLNLSDAIAFNPPENLSWYYKVMQVIYDSNRQEILVVWEARLARTE